jgi:hypothetical protein
MRRILLITGTLGYWALALALSATPAIAMSAEVSGLQAVSAKVATAVNQTATDAVKSAQAWGKADAERKAVEAEAARVAAEQAAAQAATQQAAQQQAVEEQAAQVAANEEGDAWSILASYGLEGVSLSFGETYGYEAISYYKSGHIVISPTHTYSLSTLIAHEVNHIIAWRQSGKTTE